MDKSEDEEEAAPDVAYIVAVRLGIALITGSVDTVSSWSVYATSTSAGEPDIEVTYTDNPVGAVQPNIRIQNIKTKIIIIKKEKYFLFI